MNNRRDATHMKKLLTILAAAMVAVSASAQDRIAVVDMDTLFNEYHKKKIADIELKRQAETYKKYADELGASLEKFQQEFKTLRDDSLNIALSDVERENKRLSAQDKYRQMKEKEEELKSYSIEKQNMLKGKYEEIRERLVAEIKAVAGKAASEAGYGIVLDKSGRTSNQISSVVHHSAEIDISEIVLKKLNPDESRSAGNGKEEKQEQQNKEQAK
jgi:Skp family chaperone for outer membrane proteins